MAGGYISNFLVLLVAITQSQIGFKSNEIALVGRRQYCLCCRLYSLKGGWKQCSDSNSNAVIDELLCAADVVVVCSDGYKRVAIPCVFAKLEETVMLVVILALIHDWKMKW